MSKKKRSMLTLIEVLKASNSAPEPQAWQQFEEHVQNVYQTILDLKGETVLVARDVQLRGRDGSSFQIDVYYEFEVAGLRHRVAIECKNTQRPVDRNAVIAFKGKVDDCLDVRGVIVAANGYQSGAKKFAQDNGLTALTVEDLPSIGKLLGMRLEHVIVPGVSSIGHPFWTLYEVETGAPYGQEQDSSLFAFLFFSRRHAEAFKLTRGVSDEWEVRGLSQHHLGAYIMMVDAFAGRYLVARPQFQSQIQNGMLFDEISRADLIAEYFEGDNPLPSEPMVAPSYHRA